MGDFLNQFEGKSAVKKPEEAAPLGGPVIRGPSHASEYDKSFHRNKVIKIIAVVIGIIAVMFAAYMLIRMSNRVEMKSLIGGNLTDAQNWAIRNRVELEISREFSMEHAKDVVFAQDITEGHVQKGAVVGIKVSDGLDPDERLTLPDFSDMDVADVSKWINDNKATNARIQREFSSTVADRAFLRVEFPNDIVNENNYSRKDIVVIYMSKGPEVAEKNITVPNFAGKLEPEVITWADTNKIKVTIETAASDTITEGRVISQSEEFGTKVAVGHEMTVVVSVGVGVTVPNFAALTMSSAATAVTGVMVNVKQQYNASVPFGGLISQSHPAGTVLLGSEIQKARIEVVYSLGRPYIDDLVGRSERELAAYFYEFREKGASVSYSIEYVDSYQTKGRVIAVNRSNEFIESNAVINVQVSRGNLEPPASPSVPGNDGSLGGDASSGSDGFPGDGGFPGAH